jgi:hypothetical protein
MAFYLEFLAVVRSCHLFFESIAFPPHSLSPFCLRNRDAIMAGDEGEKRRSSLPKNLQPFILTAPLWPNTMSSQQTRSEAQSQGSRRPPEAGQSERDDGQPLYYGPFDRMPLHAGAMDPTLPGPSSIPHGSSHRPVSRTETVGPRYPGAGMIHPPSSQGYSPYRPQEDVLPTRRVPIEEEEPAPPVAHRQLPPVLLSERMQLPEEAPVMRGMTYSELATPLEPSPQLVAGPSRGRDESAFVDSGDSSALSAAFKMTITYPPLIRVT